MKIKFTKTMRYFELLPSISFDYYDEDLYVIYLGWFCFRVSIVIKEPEFYEW